MQHKRIAHRFLVGKHEGKRRLGRPRRDWKNNTKLISKKRGENIWIEFIWFRIRTSEGL